MSIRLSDIAAERAFVALWRALPAAVREQFIEQMAEAHSVSCVAFYTEPGERDATVADVAGVEEAQDDHRSGDDFGGSAAGKGDRQDVSEVVRSMGSAPQEALSRTASSNGHDGAARSGNAELSEPDIPLDLIRDPDLRIIETLRRAVA